MTPQQLKAMKLALEALELLTGAWQTFDALDYGDNAITALKEALAEHAMQEVQRLGQEIESDDIASILACRDMLDAQPVPPQRKPLTDKAITKVIDSMPKKMKGFGVDWDLYEFARAIEAAHGIKENT